MNDPVEDLRRATEAVLAAPATEHGLIVPPHILEEQRREKAAEAAQLPLNRAQRRRQAKYARSAAGRRAAAQRAAQTPEQRDMMGGFEESTAALNEKQMSVAGAFLTRLAKMTPLEREQALENLKHEIEDE